MPFRNAALLLIAASVLFWLSWLLMPGVGVTDAAQIVNLVSHQRSSVLASVVTQLLSAALYVPALLGIGTAASGTSTPGVRWGAGLLLIGAMGCAIDAVFHLLAYAMTMPGLETGSLLRVMAFMQGPGLRLVGPFIGSFFVGGPLLSVTFAKKRTVSNTSIRIYLVALGIAIVGGVAASTGSLSARAVGLAVLGAISIAQACLGVELFRAHEGASFAAKCP
jgi:hypothetical protein